MYTTDIKKKEVRMHEMNYMFETGFLGTRAPYFMDVVTLIVAILPLLVYSSILFARRKEFKLHMLTQNLIFFVSVIVITYFELGVRVGGGFDAFISDASVSHTYALWVLIIHILIAVTTLFYWIRTIIHGNYSYAKKSLPGNASAAHKSMALKSMLGIIFTSFTGVWVYILLFVY